MKTNDDFESKIKIEEGESGHWFNQKDFLRLENRLMHDGEVLNAFFDRMNKDLTNTS